jgi:hypothetical protein
MKLYSLLIIFIISVFVGCGKREDPSPLVTNNQSGTIDSLKRVIQQKDTAYNNLRSDYRSWVVHTFDTENHCLIYAKAVKNNSSNSVFMVGWTTRAFSWAHEWKKKKR